MSRYYVYMRRTIGRITIFAVLAITLGTGLLLVGLWSVDDALNYEPSLTVGAIDQADISAKAYLVFDMETGTEITSFNSTEVLPIASVTKLFTAAVYRKTADMQGTTTIAWSDINTEGRAGKLQAFQAYNNHELLYPLLLESSNDAAVAMLRSHETLLADMNDYASTSKAVYTVFADTSGLSERNVSNAYELFILARKVYLEQPHLFDIAQLKQYIGTYTGWMNNSPLVNEKGYKGGKHGFTYEANRTGVFVFEETLNNEQKRLFGYVVLGSDDLLADISVLRAQIQTNVRFE